MKNINNYQQPFQAFPSRMDHVNQWRELASEIAENAETISHDPQQINPPEHPGELTILGSGIETVGFTSSDELRIREADKVFYCVADPATVVWLKNLRSDAYDLYVLYDDTKLRYITYMQMTEAMLHYVRKGQNVVAIFYGHPGIFVLSTHRAVQIGRREGHKVTMRAGISALDTLCADLGIDPSQPGMQTFEATDTLIRRRHLDPEIHLVLWQVGLVGDLGYRREGSLNSGFSVLLDYLEETYGPDHEVINYIGSRYPGIDPICEKHTIASLRDPGTQSTVTGISTFYIPPARCAKSDIDMLMRLGLLKPGQSVRQQESPLRIIDKYGAREFKAFTDFAHFDVPSGYHWQEDTAPARFILALREDGELRSRYQENPRAAMSQWGGGLSETDRRRLSLREAGAMQIAAKGLQTKVPNESSRMLREVLTRETSARSLLSSVKSANDPRMAAEQWSQYQGFDIDWSNLTSDLQITLRRSLYPWTGCYLAKYREMSIVIHGQPSGDQADCLYINGKRVNAKLTAQGMIVWKSEDDGGTSGLLRADRTPRGARRLVGSIWSGKEKPESSDQIIAVEHILPNTLPLASLVGGYQASPALQVSICRNSHSPGAPLQILINGEEAKSDARVDASSFSVDGHIIPFTNRESVQQIVTSDYGKYNVRLVHRDKANMASIDLQKDKCLINGQQVNLTVNKDGSYVWTNGPSPLNLGEFKTLLDPISLSPMLFGSAGMEETENMFALRGMVPVCQSSVDRRISSADYGLPEWAWKDLVEISANASQNGGLFLWHGWSRSVNNLRRINRVLRVIGEK